MSGALPNLPDITFAELAPAEVERGIITMYEGLTKKTLFPGDPVRLFLESLAYLIIMQNAAIDAAGKQNLLAYAQKAHLDHLGALMDTPRLEASPAVTVVRYTLKEIQTWPVLVPEGSRITVSSGGLVFTTDRTVTISAGALSVDVPVTCSEAGMRETGCCPVRSARWWISFPMCIQWSILSLLP